ARQARQAQRYKHIAAEIRSAEASVAYLRWLAARAQLEEAEAILAEADQAAIDATEGQTASTTAAAVAAHELPALREAEARAAAGLQRL
ncbi:hypothetical protein ABTB15_19550, partial [Acinetobacter baumannii]